LFDTKAELKRGVELQFIAPWNLIFWRNVNAVRHREPLYEIRWNGVHSLEQLPALSTGRNLHEINGRVINGKGFVLSGGATKSGATQGDANTLLTGAHTYIHA